MSPHSHVNGYEQKPEINEYRRGWRGGENSINRVAVEDAKTGPQCIQQRIDTLASPLTGTDSCVQAVTCICTVTVVVFAKAKCESNRCAHQ